MTLRVDPRRRPFALRAFEFVGMTWNVRFVLVDEDASLVYAESSSDAAAGTPTIRCDPRYYAPGGDFRQVVSDGELYWVPRGSGASDADDIGTVVRMLGLLDDPAPARRRASDLTAQSVHAFAEDRRALAASPVADHAAHRVLERARLRTTELGHRWPGGKTYALCLTHDVDSPEIGNPRELMRSAAKAVLRRRRKYWWSLGRGVAALARGNAGEFWTFRDWQRYEADRNLRSAFYVYPDAPGVPRHRNDPRYDIQGERWSVLAELEDDGWEIGVHHGIRSRDATAHLVREKQTLEQRGLHIDGSRHHYWELDWRSPSTTFRRHAEAKYRYDASMTWRDVPGFRSGTAQPYLPWDAATGARIDLVVLPTCLMDGHLFEHLALGAEEANAAAADVVAAARAARGVAALDWHERTFADSPMYPGWRNLLDRLLDDLVARGDAWIALPREIAAFVHARARATRIES